MNLCEGLYAPRGTNSTIYFWAVLGFLGFPLSFYLYLMYLSDIYWNISVLVIILSVAFSFPKIIVARVRVEVKEASIHMESYFFSKWTPPHDIPFEQIGKATLISDSFTSTLQVEDVNGCTISMFKPERSAIEKLKYAIPEKFCEQPVNKKKSLKIAFAVIGFVIADIALIFVAIYLGT